MTSNDEILARAKKQISDDIASTFANASDDKKDDKDDKETDKPDDKDDKKDEKSDDKDKDDKGSDDKEDKDEDKKDDDKDDADDKKADDKDDDKDERKGGDEEEEDDALTQLSAQNQALLAEVESLSGQIFAVGTSATDQKSDKSDEKKDDKADDKKEEKGDKKPLQFVDQESFEESISSAEGLNALLTKAVDIATEEGERRGYERAIRETPALVEQLTEKSVGVREAVRDFLSANKDLVPVRQFVGVVTNQLRAENPEWPIDKLFEEAGKVVRERLKLSKVVKEIDDEKGSDGKPAFVKRGSVDKGRKGTESKLSPLAEEIAELASVAII